VASILLVSALLKWSALHAGFAVKVGSWMLPNTLAIAAISAEFTVGSLLLAGWLSRLARWGTLILLTVFAMLGSVMLAHSAHSCGCFGVVTEPPWITLIADIMLLAGLVWSWRSGGGTSAGGLARLGWVMMCLAAGCALALAMPSKAGQAQAKATGARGAFAFPATVADWRRGVWVVVFFRDSCTQCRGHVCDWVSRAAADHDRRWAFVDVGGAHGPELMQQCSSRALVTWSSPDPLLATPWCLLIEDGQVIATAASPDLLQEDGSGGGLP